MIHDDSNEKKAAFSFKVWKKIFAYFKGIRHKFFTLLALVAVSVIISIFFNQFQGWLIDNMIGKNTLNGIWIFTAVYFAMVAVQTVVLAIFFRMCITFEMQSSQLLRDNIFKKFQIFEVSYFSNRAVGYLVAKTMSDTERIANIVSWGTIDMGWHVLYIAGSFVAMFIINWKLAFVIFLILPVAFLFSKLFQGKLLKMNRGIRAANSSVSAGLNEGITGAKTAKTLNLDDRLNREFRGLTADMYKKSSKYNRLHSLYVSFLYGLGSFVTAAILVFSGYNKGPGGMTIGQLAIFLTYAVSIIEPVMMLSEFLTNLISNQANAERTLSILERPAALTDRPEVIEKYGDFFNPKTENWEEMQGEIEFKNVSFKYEDDSKYILKNFNLKIPKGSSLALVGETGAGKTTIVNLLCRFHHPTEGEILIDGVDYRQRSQLWLERNLGYVLQTPHLFSGTIRDNIRYGRPSASDLETESAAEAVSANRVALKLKKGYDSEVGECGDKLSTGEKQLITFARALLADPKIIILDEATSSIDTETEYLIQKAIANLLKGRTSIMIAHRLSTIRNADMIVLIENGGIKESGTHKELMSLGGDYYNLYKRMEIVQK